MEYLDLKICRNCELFDWVNDITPFCSKHEMVINPMGKCKHFKFYKYEQG